jgi:predicted phosphoribosyltransferase
MFSRHFADSNIMIIYPDGAEAGVSDSPQIEKFSNLRTAGHELAIKLEPHRNDPNRIVLGIVLGGIPVAHEVAQHLNAPFDLIVLRRLLAPQGPGSEISAATVAGHLVLPDQITPLPEKPSTPFEYFVADALSGLQERTATCRGARPPVDVAGKTVLLVDCGAHTGSTMKAAIDALRGSRPHRIIAAVPVISTGSLQILSSYADELIWLVSPQRFGNVSVWYQDFSRPGDEALSELLGSAAQS